MHKEKHQSACIIFVYLKKSHGTDPTCATNLPINHTHTQKLLGHLASQNILFFIGRNKSAAKYCEFLFIRIAFGC